MVYRASALRGLAITQMVLGALMVVLAVASIFAVPHWSSYVAFGIWIGIWVLITGILGYIGARNDGFPSNCLIGCFMGFSIVGCVLAGTMFICYCVALAEFAQRLRCPTYYDYNDYDYNSGYPRYYDSRCYYYSYSYIKRDAARNGAGLGSCLLIFAVVEFFVALASSIYCCNAVCCGSGPTGPAQIQTQTQQVMFVPAQQMYQGGQAGMVVIQPSGQITTMPTNYPAPGQQPMFVSQQPMQQMQPAYWAPTSVPGGAVPVSYAAAGGTMQPQGTLAQQPYKNVEMPPPYYTGSAGMAPVASDNPHPPPAGAQGAFNV